MTYFLDLRQQNTAGHVADEVSPIKAGPNDGGRFTKITVNEILNAAAGKAVLFGTHGFAVNRKDGIDCLAWWERALTLQNTLFVGVLWPGDSWLPYIDYPVEGNEAIKSGQLLAKFIDANFQDFPISFASHSLGARMVLETIDKMARIRVDRLSLMAGAIDNTCLENEYRDASRKAAAISILASPKDYVLWLAFPLGNYLQGILTREHPYTKAALGREGPSGWFPGTIRPGWLINNDWDYGHLDYLPKNVIPPGDVIPPPVTTAGSTPAVKPAWSAAYVSS